MPTPFQLQEDERKRKRLMELMQAGQSQNMADAQDQWNKEDFAATLRIGGTPDEKKYFDSLRTRGRAKQAQALLSGMPAESAVETFQPEEGSNSYRGRMFTAPPRVETGTEMNPRLANDLDVEQLKQQRLQTEQGELAIRALRQQTDPTEQRRKMLNAEADVRRQQGVTPSPIAVTQTPTGPAASGGSEMPPWKVAELGAGRAGAFERGQTGLDRSATAKQMMTDPNLLALQDRTRREGIEPELIKALSNVGQPSYTSDANPAVMDELLRRLGGGTAPSATGAPPPGSPVKPTASHAPTPTGQVITLAQLRSWNPGVSDADLLEQARLDGVTVR